MGFYGGFVAQTGTSRRRQSDPATCLQKLPIGGKSWREWLVLFARLTGTWWRNFVWDIRRWIMLNQSQFGITWCTVPFRKIRTWFNGSRPFFWIIAGQILCQSSMHNSSPWNDPHKLNPIAPTCYIGWCIFWELHRGLDSVVISCSAGIPS